MRAFFVCAVVALVTSSVACLHDFDQFEGAADASPGAVADTGTPPPSSTSDASVDAAKADAAVDSGPCTATPETCTTALTKCKTDCSTTENACEDACGGSGGCRNNCRQQEADCRGTCQFTCRTCAGTCPTRACNN